MSSMRRKAEPEPEAVDEDERAQQAEQATAQAALHLPSATINPQLVKSRIQLPDPPSVNTIRFLMSTDNHLGYGGDLFHDNKPSRPCMYRCLNLLRQYCLGDRPVSFEVVSDQQKNFPHTGHVNYEDPNVNISIPVFSIHGNHDDPAGVGGLSPLDLLNECFLINYFGKADRVDKITNYPLLIRKGSTKVAVYGLGNIRDERLHRTFQANDVKWVRPDGAYAGGSTNSTSVGRSNVDWFNLCVLHQNRVPHSFHDKNFISASQLPDFLDLVFWGHEHECIMDEQSEEGQFMIVQPGSSVATSLSQGEAVDKHVAIVEIQGDQYRLVKIPLYTTRPFLISDISLSERIAADDPDPSTAVESMLTDKVESMLSEISSNPKFSNPDRPSPPLIRLRVEHTGFARLNVSKFGQKFVGKVANPDEIISFYKQRQPSTHSKCIIESPDFNEHTCGVTASNVVHCTSAGVVVVSLSVVAKGLGDVDESLLAARDVGLDLSPRMDPHDLLLVSLLLTVVLCCICVWVDEAPPIQDIVSQLISHTPLSILPEHKFADAVEQYVDKKSLQAIQDFVNDSLVRQQKELRTDKTLANRSSPLTAEDLQQIVRKKHDAEEAKHQKKVTKTETEEAKDYLEGLDLDVLKQKYGRHDMEDDDDYDYGLDDEDEEKKSPARGGGRGRGRGRGRGKAAAVAADSAATGRGSRGGRGRGRGRARAAASVSASSATQSRRGRGAKREPSLLDDGMDVDDEDLPLSRSRGLLHDDDDDEAEFGDEWKVNGNEEQESKGERATGAKQKPAARRSKSGQRMDDEDADEEGNVNKQIQVPADVADGDDSSSMFPRSSRSSSSSSSSSRRGGQAMKQEPSAPLRRGELSFLTSTAKRRGGSAAAAPSFPSASGITNKKGEKKDMVDLLEDED